ncbi:hypothetical protein [Nitrospirillum viridazoti]|uniref:Uncharacterized protein n=1 Tax=Nitrospirillum viridazoti CBAmc TaxID=1441467 RepID=A0A248K246_9PROT|nr:hypothetical protein [Nitrospirillum amazonense]ASG25045.1 hypothetical protein Y958_29165 [Nitrospirillum amazonense CBAmc]TWB31201.1 hypothetical protein FBZ91_1209 [Nitrospirillum amazonense]
MRHDLANLQPGETVLIHRVAWAQPPCSWPGRSAPRILTTIDGAIAGGVLALETDVTIAYKTEDFASAVAGTMEGWDMEVIIGAHTYKRKIQSLSHGG